MRTTGVNRTEIRAVIVANRVEGLGRGGLAEGQRLFEGEISPSKWPTRGEIAEAVII